MLGVYGHYKYFYFYSAGIDFSRQIDPRAVRVKALHKRSAAITLCICEQFATLFIEIKTS